VVLEIGSGPIYGWRTLSTFLGITKYYVIEPTHDSQFRELNLVYFDGYALEGRSFAHAIGGRSGFKVNVIRQVDRAF
jgi:hypothetical protein